MSADAPVRPAREPAAGDQSPRMPAHRRLLPLLKYAATPIVLGVVLLGLYLYISAQALSAVERRTLNASYIVSRTIKHLELTAIVAALVLVIAVPLGVVLTRSFARRFVAPVLALANIGQAIPSIGLLVLFAVAFITVGVNIIAMIAFVVYAILPILRNTMVGLEQVDHSTIEAARGMGMSRGAVLARVELPLAVPVILAGIRTSLVLTVGTVALATFIGAGGLGDIISAGITSNLLTTVAFAGAVMVAVLALLVDWVAGIAEDVLRPRGL